MFTFTPCGVMVYCLFMAKKTDPQYVIDLGSRLVKAKADVKRLQQEWDCLFATQDTDSKPATREGRGETTVDRVINLLDVKHEQAFTVDQIVTLLSLPNKQSAATTLSKLVKKQRVKKYGADQYVSIHSTLPEPVARMGISQVA
jgi:hypothetical protein